jgi:hypothetical protein
MRGDVGLQPVSETFPKAKALIDKAVALGDNVADLHVAVGNHNEAGEVVGIVQRASDRVGVGAGVEIIRDRVGRYAEKPQQPYRYGV